MDNHQALLQECRNIINQMIDGKTGMVSPMPDSLALSPDESDFILSFNRFLSKFKEGNHFIDEVCQGRLEADPPPNNQLISHFKQLQADLRHLVWQTRRLAAGDLNQKVDFMGDFSVAFNTLIESLREKNALEEQIRKSEIFHKTLLDTSPDGITVVDINGIQQFVSEKGHAMFGYETPDELIGKNFMDLFTPEYQEKAKNAVNDLLKGKYTGVTEYQVIQNNGGPFWVEANAEVLLNENGVPEAMMFVYRDTTQKKMLEQQLQEYSRMIEHQARTDRMTGMLNHTEGMEMLRNELALTVKTNLELTVCFIDMDGLKHINDQNGHAEGDRMILALSGCIQKCIRAHDYVARMGGDEFMIIFPQCGSTQAEGVLTRITSSTEALSIEENYKFPLSFSYGIAVYHPGDSISAEQLVRVADEQMYNQKRLKKANLSAAVA